MPRFTAEPRLTEEPVVTRLMRFVVVPLFTLPEVVTRFPPVMAVVCLLPPKLLDATVLLIRDLYRFNDAVPGDTTFLRLPLLTFAA